jgi:hypothetical protein
MQVPPIIVELCQTLRRQVLFVRHYIRQAAVNRGCHSALSSLLSITNSEMFSVVAPSCSQKLTFLIIRFVGCEM